MVKVVGWLETRSDRVFNFDRYLANYLNEHVFEGRDDAACSTSSDEVFVQIDGHVVHVPWPQWAIDLRIRNRSLYGCGLTGEELVGVMIRLRDQKRRENPKRGDCIPH